MTRTKDESLGSVIALESCCADIPTAKIIDRARDCFASLSSRLDIIRGGPIGPALARDPAWPGILREVSGMTARFPATIGNTVTAAAFCEEILDLEEEIDHLVILAEREPDES